MSFEISFTYHLVAAIAVMVVALVLRKKIGGLGPMFIAGLALLDVVHSILRLVMLYVIEWQVPFERLRWMELTSFVFTLAGAVFAVIAFSLMRSAPS